MNKKEGKKRFSIGEEKESALHRQLKFRYAGEGGRVEETVGGFVCDCLSPAGEMVEVQTGSFAPLTEKVKALARMGAMRIIHPIGVIKYIELYDTEHTLIYRRKSPKRGSSWEVFKALLHAPLLPLCGNLVIELALVEILEKRVRDGKGSWRRGGVSIAERSLSAWQGSIELKSPADYRRFIPFERGMSFTVKDLSLKAGISPGLARKCLYVTGKMGLVERTGKAGRAFLYALV